jgi:hypothetical protein
MPVWGRYSGVPMRRFAVLMLVAATAAAFSVVVTAGPSGAAVASPLGLSCAAYGGQQMCSGGVPSFDGTPLDLDVTMPTAGTGPHPLIVLLHGFGNDKHEWESTDDNADNADKWHWNSHWFAAQGYYVLTYTARGFGDDGASAPYEPATPPGTTCPKKGSDCPPAGTIRVKNKNVEIRDTQWLAAKVAAAFPEDIDVNRVAVSGGSYGGGESWLQAAAPTWDFPNSRDATLPVLNLQVAVPKYPWTDLAYSLAPSGRGPDVYSSSSGPPTDPSGNGNPFGVGKTSYIAGLYALGTKTGTFEQGANTTPQDQGPDPEVYPPTEPFSAWLARLTAGEPYSAGPNTDEAVVGQVRQAFSHWHSAYYQPGWRAQQLAQHETAVFSVSGWTDDLFPAVESFRMFNYLKGLDPNWPVEVRTADVGHARAQNKPGTWQLINDQAWAFLQSQIDGAHAATTTVASQVTDCTANASPAAQEVSASTPAGLGVGTLEVTAARPAVLAPTSGVGDPDGVRTDAIVGGSIPLGPGGHGGCTVGTTPTPKKATFGYRAVSAPLPAAETTTGIGYVQANYAATPGVTGVVAARVWDVGPDGTPLLISRGVYRLDFLYGDKPTGTMQVPFYGNHWNLAAGHRLRLDLQQADSPTYRPPTGAVSTLTLTGVRLVLPVRSSGSSTLPAS